MYNKCGSLSNQWCIVLAVTHSLWGCCQPRLLTGTTWCSPLLWRYSSSPSIASGNIIPILLTTSGRQNVLCCSRNEAPPPSQHLRVGTTKRMTTECEIDSWTPFLLLLLLPNSHTTPLSPLHEHLIRLFFWSGPPLSASPPISSEAPVFFLHRGAELECRAPPLWQCSWLIPKQSDSWETPNELPKLKPQLTLSRHKDVSRTSKSLAYYWIYLKFYYRTPRSSASFVIVVSGTSRSKISGGGIFHTVLMATEPSLSSFSFTSMWIAIVRVGIHSLFL